MRLDVFNREWKQCLRKAALMQSGSQLRSFFVTIVIHGAPAQSRHSWNTFQVTLSDDCAYRLRQNENTEPFTDQITSLTATVLATFEKNLADFSLPVPTEHHQPDKYLYACSACEVVHDGIRCPMEESYNLIRKRHVPT